MITSIGEEVQVFLTTNILHQLLTWNIQNWNMTMPQSQGHINIQCIDDFPVLSTELFMKENNLTARGDFNIHVNDAQITDVQTWLLLRDWSKT